ncbi:ABC transporter substrate-binding protein [Paraburkholderia sp. CNPSo 3274]|uniref:ABC transporter substrate-binding protein n=1 Tax=Paraburkholderia sp. CNPSo 3274 TaxID=2940932 RepID=UPI0020B789B8|nr:ABC transporter substrate-binding protein [Paraburkholderia sp. CNPSo 3274]MCP3710777.1 ABC transporter substrate-binding protein [Paraburkholderia sp. CNPSo 3274]
MQSIAKLKGMRLHTSLATLKILGFEGAFNLPFWVAEDQRLFEKYGLTTSFEYVKGSIDMINRMNAGDAHIAFASVDNVFAYTDGHGETADGSAPDLVAFMGGDHGFLSLVARPGLTSVRELSGKTLAVDALTTGFAFVLREILSLNDIAADGVKFDAAGGTGNRYRALVAGKYAATLVRTPFERLAERQGFRTLATSAALFPDYLGTVGVVRESWASANRARLIGFILAYREALNWIFDPANAAACRALLRAQFPELSDADARAVLDDLVHPTHGLIRDMEIEDAGLALVMRIRDAHATAPVTRPRRPCVDRQYLNEARASMAWAPPLDVQ